VSTLALITGASQGIGAKIAEVLAAEPGYKLALLARNEENLVKVAQRCRELGAQASFYACDLTLEAEVQRVSALVEDEMGTPDLLVNNAGHFLRADLCEMNGADFQSVMDSNLTTAFLVSRAFIGAMRARKSGTIFFMGSVASKQAYPESGAYCVAKHALLGLARSFRAATRDSGVRITTLMPGATQSPSWVDTEVPQDRLMPATDIANSLLEIYKLSSRTVVEEIILRPLGGDV
jgi:NAD(P)-dependent dehydrogenase (short-subunit alcohol dehydrogenase family)